MDGYSVAIPKDAVSTEAGAVALVRSAMKAAGRPDGRVIHHEDMGDAWEVVITVNPVERPRTVREWRDANTLTAMVADAVGVRVGCE